MAPGGLLLLLGALVTFLAGRALGPGREPRITGYRPLLGGLPRPPAGWATDGQRAYYTIDREGRFEAYQAPLAGGEAVRLDLPFQQALVMDASPRQSAILVAGWDGGLTEKEEKDLPLWIVPVPAGAARNTGPRVRAASWSPDGERLAFSGGSDDYNEAAPGALVMPLDPMRRTGVGRRQGGRSHGGRGGKSTLSGNCERIHAIR